MAVVGVISFFLLTAKTTWSLSDEKPGPKMIECVFRGFWSELLHIRIVIEQSCAGI